MLRRKFISSVSSILPCSVLAIPGVDPVEEKIPFALTSESLSMTLNKEKVEEFTQLFPKGCYATEENIQTLLDHGFNIFDFINAKVPITGNFNVNGDRYWCKEGKYHREGGPAIIEADGSQCWYKEGLRHRLDGPAILHSSGHEEWFKEGKCHREGGPAVTWANRTQFWCKEGKFYEPSYLV